MTFVRVEDWRGRFWGKVDKSEGCWLWMAGKSSWGYGRFWLDGREVQAHRLAYELVVGPIPLGLSIDHLCRVRNCVRADHLEPVPIVVNVMRGTAPPALNALKTQCVHGHPFDEANTYTDRLGARHCRACQRRRDRQRRSREANLRREANGGKLTEGAVREIRAAWPNATLASLARKHAVTSRSIYLVVTQQTWKHVA